MAEKATLARPYALAAFKQAEQSNALAEWSSILQFLSALVRDPAMVKIVSHPRIEKERLTSLLVDLSEGRLSEAGRNFLQILIKHQRLALLPEVATLFEQQKAESERRREVEVIVAYPLQAKQQQAIKDAMSKRLGQEVELSVKVDQALIGGIVIRAGDTVIDASLRGRLSRLELDLR
ncbi:MAG: F0F1 ATP synthase subunit delta [Gammaproteobacteria bacterium]